MFFADRTPGTPGLAVFLNAGDPPLPVLKDVVRMLDESRVDCLELAVPFPDSPTDGPVVRRSAARALAAGTTLAGTLALVAAVRPHLRHLRIALLADWSFSVRPGDLGTFLRRVRDSTADGVLLHGLPARIRTDYHDLAGQLRVPVITTCYPLSNQQTLADAARDATAYVYLVSRYGRSGGSTDFTGLSTVLASLKATAAAPVAVGFGVRTRSDADALHSIGADAVIVGSAAVTRVEASLADRTDPVAQLHQFISEFRTNTDGVRNDHPGDLQRQDRRLGKRPEPALPARS
jgi:tryptophan synthase alpha chain